MTPAAVHHGRVPELHVAGSRLQASPERFVRRPPAPPALPTAAWINKPETKEVAH
jgi:putative transposase